MPVTPDTAVAQLLRDRGARQRILLGITGEPGAGKSTAADRVLAGARSAGARAALVPMDGFHVAQQVLNERGLASVKGAPETFDAAGFVALLRRLRAPSEHPIWAPCFDRELEQPIAGAIEVETDVDLVVVEGNYLLLQQDSWSDVRPLLDACWYLQPPSDDVRRQRLTDRHVQFGASPQAARERAGGSDERNARLVRATRQLADIVLTAP